MINDHQHAHEANIRKLQYRLQRQGMLELDAWLAPLLDAVQSDEASVMQAIEQLLQHEAPELQAMLAGNLPIPQELTPWLKP